MAEFFHMGGYAFYVWTSYALTTICLSSIVIWSLLQHRKVRRRAMHRAQQAIKKVRR